MSVLKKTSKPLILRIMLLVYCGLCITNFMYGFRHLSRDEGADELRFTDSTPLFYSCKVFVTRLFFAAAVQHAVVRVDRSVAGARSVAGRA